ncbi:MAG TPA: hypothetical protein VFI02_17835 [Armatimonadota bacterium]|nr:hypothetical protein [Armatimonadota bacterium]
MTSTQIIWLVIGILALEALIWIPIVVWMRRRSSGLAEETKDSVMLAGEKAIIGPEAIIFKRPMFRRFGVVGGNAVATLTDKRVIIDQLVGSKVEFPLSDIAEVKESKWFRGSARGGYTHVILKLQDGREFALLVKDPERWMEGLQQVTSKE